MDGLSQTYQKEAHGSSGKIRVLSTLAPHFKNKELKRQYRVQIMNLQKRANTHNNMGQEQLQTNRNRSDDSAFPPQDLAFVVNSIHHPDNTCRSSHRMANCEGKDHPGSQTCSTKNNNL